MTDKPQSTPAETAPRPTRDAEEQQRDNESPLAEEGRDDLAASVARRRASLDKEIRAGWQRALGH